VFSETSVFKFKAFRYNQQFLHIPRLQALKALKAVQDLQALQAPQTQKVSKVPLGSLSFTGCTIPFLNVSLDPPFLNKA